MGRNSFLLGLAVWRNLEEVAIYITVTLAILTEMEGKWAKFGLPTSCPIFPRKFALTERLRYRVSQAQST